MKQPAQREIMTLKQAAAYLRVHTSTLYRMGNEGRLPAFKLGGGWRIMRSELDAWIRRKTMGAVR